MIKEYSNVEELIEENLIDKEESGDQELIDGLKQVREKGHLTKEEFIRICMWKSARPKQLYLSNSEEEIMSISKEVFSTESEELKIALLTKLKGVSIPVASSILTLTNPQDYGVIDIRVWQILYLYGEVNSKPSGQGFNLNDWLTYLNKLREYAKKFNTSVRRIEISLFYYHRKNQEGRLYG